MSDLFSAAAEERLREQAPLAARLRPSSIDDVVGQEHLVGPGKPLRRLVEQDKLSSAIFWGLPAPEKRRWRWRWPEAPDVIFRS